MLTTKIFKVLYIGITMLLVTAFTISQPAQAAPADKVSNGWIPFSGYLPEAQANINGMAHIVTRWKDVSSSEVQVDVHVNLDSDDVTVITDSGVPYLAVGAGQSSIFLPPNPIFPTDPTRVDFPSFRLVLDESLPPNPVLPPNPIRSYAFGLQFDLVFSAIGILDFDATTVQVVESTVVGED